MVKGLLCVFIPLLREGIVSPARGGLLRMHIYNYIYYTPAQHPLEL